MVEYNILPNHWVIADMGCGEGKLAASVSHEVYSFDLNINKKPKF